jgi:3-oxoacyl-[acyl-carrier-protein] synthase-1
MERAPCRLAALGLVNALGGCAERVWPGLLAGETSRLSWRDDLVPGRDLLVGAVTDPLPDIPPALARYACRNNAMALAGLVQIEAAVRNAVDTFGASRVGVVMGTSTSGVSSAEDSFRYQLAHGGLEPSFVVADHLGARGPAYTLSTACSSGARALASGRSLLTLGLCDAVVAGGADTLCGLTANGFSTLQAICEGVTNPCSLHRAGLTLGEGSAVFLLRREAGGVQLVGVGESSEAHHMSAPEPTGAGAEAAMRGALDDAGLGPEAIAYLNLHGTGTPQNDRMECLAVARVFGTALPASSTKPLVGHTLGAAGALEAAFCWLVLDRSEGGVLELPPHCWDGERDPELPEIHLARKGETLRVRGPLRVMTNSFGFGGNNCTLVLERSS